MPGSTLARSVKALPALAFLAVLAEAAWVRFRLPLAPYTDGDLGAYLTPGLGKLLGGDFRHVHGQCFLYPGFLYTVLRVCGDFRAVTAMQQLLGLGTGALLYGSWLELRRFLPAPRLPLAVFQCTGVLLAAVYLFSTTSIAFERALRPEAIFPFFAVLQIYSNLRFIRCRFFDDRPRAALLSGGAAIFVCALAWLLKPSFSAMLLLGNLPVLFSLFRPGQSAAGKVILIGVPTLAAVLLLILPEWKLRQQDPMGALFLAQSLFSIHGDLIDDQMAADLARGAATPYPAAFVSAAHEKLAGALRESRTGEARYWPALGFNADYLLNGDAEHEAFTRWLFLQLGGPGAADFCRYYYGRTLRQQPGRMLAKIGRQFGVFYRFGDCPAYVNYAMRGLADDYRNSLPLLRSNPDLDRYPPGRSLLAQTEVLQTSSQQIGPYPVTMWCDQLLAGGYLPGCLGALLLGAAAWKVRAWRAAALVLLLLFAYNFGTVLTIAIGHTLDVGRYSMYQLAYTLLPEFAALWLGVEVLARAGDGRQFSRLAMFTDLSIRARPLKTLGAFAAVLLLIAAVLAAAPLRHARDKKYRKSPTRVVAAAVFLVAGLLSLQTGVLLHFTARTDLPPGDNPLPKFPG